MDNLGNYSTPKKGLRPLLKTQFFVFVEIKKGGGEKEGVPVDEER